MLHAVTTEFRRYPGGPVVVVVVNNAPSPKPKTTTRRPLFPSINITSIIASKSGVIRSGINLASRKCTNAITVQEAVK